MKHMPRKPVVILLVVIFITGFRKGEKDSPYLFPEPYLFNKMPVAEDNPVTVAGVDLGRHLFYDPILSADSSISCASCHRQEAAFSDAPKQYSTGIGGAVATRNTMPLFNLAWYPALFWDGRGGSIEEQVFHPVRTHNEMNLQWDLAVERVRHSRLYRTKFKAAFGNARIDSVLIAKAIAQFERTLISYNSKYDSVLREEAYFSKAELKGFELVTDMSMADCLHCHTVDSDPMGTTLGFSNNGLDDIKDPGDYTDKGVGGITGKKEDNGKFRIPSLRNIALTAPYMHDGRFRTLKEVLDFYSEGVHASVNVDSKMGSAHRGGVHLTEDEKYFIISFLSTLTDSVFIKEPAFGSPFNRKGE